MTDASQRWQGIGNSTPNTAERVLVPAFVRWIIKIVVVDW